ncbi:MAG: hypothetical protein JNG89_06655 [Planctomycetaceae bacterium]|nr:hypothetical protein [Planctomycetaceae bacterium]
MNSRFSSDVADDTVPTEDVEIVGPPETLGQSDIAGQTTDSGKGRIFPCEGCGADLHFDIGQQRLKCPYCGFEKELELREDAEIREQDLEGMLQRVQAQHDAGHADDQPGDQEVRCESCAGTVLFTGTLTSSECPYCGSPIQREKIHSATQRIPVDGVLPFLVDESVARRKLAEWISSRWFAPTEFTKRGAEGRFNGVYLPYWTFDAMTFNVYRGERGENYTVTVGSGNNRRTETRTRWYDAHGNFQRFFDDVLVVATTGLPRNYILGLEPWPLAKCLPFTQQVLAGYMARTYDLPLQGGFEDAKQRVKDAIHIDVCQRIGGDQQRIHVLNTRLDALTFKHLLLPVWMLAYRHHGKPYRVFINAGTGEVQGERPYSFVKIAFAVLGIAAVALLAAFLLAQR